MFDKRFLKQIYFSFKSVNGFLITFIGSIITILSFLFQDKLGVNSWIVLITIVAVILIVTFYDTALNFYYQSLNTSPSVLKVIIRNDKTILLTEYSDYLQIQGLVTVFWKNEEYEEFVGYGEVINIQNDKKIQIDLKSKNENIDNLEEKKKSLLVKPFITLKTIE